MKLGNKVRDRITGIEGIVFGITDWLYGCRTVTVKPSARKDDGAIPDSVSFDEPQLEVIGDGLAEPGPQPSREYTGGPDRHVTRDRAV